LRALRLPWMLVGMHRIHRRACLSAVLTLGSLAPLARAQWSTNPAVNLPVGDASGEQINSKLAADGAGGTWVGWFDNSGGSYAVRLQHLDARGFERFAHNGLLVSGHPQSSSLVDWDLMCDAQGACVLAFTDTRAGGDRDVQVYRILADGSFDWGVDGVTLSSNADDEANPRLAQLSDGNYVCVWSRTEVGDDSVRMQKLDPAGAPQFAADGIAITGAATEDLGFARVVAAESGNYIVSWLRDITPFSAPRHLRARKYDGSGAAVWASYTAVYDFNALPIAHDPILQPDGAGGAWFAWHRSSGTTFDALVQHLDANGVELFAHNGLAVSTEASRSKFSPSLAQHPSGDVIVAFNKRNTSQSTWASCVQRISAGGVRLWTDDGVELAPYDTVNESFERCVLSGDGAVVLWFEQPTALPGKKVKGQRVDGNGVIQWTPGGIDLCTAVTSKDDLEIVNDASGIVRCSWTDDRGLGLANDVYAQNVNADASLGGPFDIQAMCSGDGSLVDHTTPCPCANDGSAGNGCAHSFDPNGANLAASGVAALDDVVLHSTNTPVSSFTLFMQHDAAGDQTFHDGVLCAAGTLIRLRGRNAVGGEAFFPNSAFANDVTLTLSQRGQVFPGQGVRRWYAGWYRNASTTFCPPATANVSNGLTIDW